MEGVDFQFVGPPCIRHTNYVFYKAFNYKSHTRSKILAIGDFFFLKILQEIPICIAEVELLWEDKASNQLLSSLRLYFRPEHTPDGRQDDTGEDEVLALGERVVLRLDDLVPLIHDEVKWSYGSTSPCSTASAGSDVSVTKTNGSGPGMGDSKSTNDADISSKKTDEESDVGAKNGFMVKEENGDARNDGGVSSGAANIAVMNYARYCRYRAVCKRLEGCESEWLHVAVVVAIGGYNSRSPGCRVMYCRDTFYQAEIDDWDCRMDHMLPVLKTKKMKKSKVSKKDSPQDSDSMEELFANVVPTISSSSRPRRSTESGEMNDDKVSTHEQAFLIGLHKFMHDAKMPIGRIPSLGFKQIDLYYFYKQADKLGGYDSITHKRMWKHLYDKLGGNSSNTSAATCTRKHYERLLLPYERHLRKLKALKNKKHGIHGEEDEKGAKPGSKKEQVDSKKHDALGNTGNESKFGKDRQKGSLGSSRSSSSTTEHSKYQSVDTEVLEIPVVRHRGSTASKTSSSSALPPGFPPGFDLQGMESLTFGQLEQLQQQAMATGDPAAAAAYANMLYQSGYLMPLLPPHLLQAQWGPLLGHPSSAHPSGAIPPHLDGSLMLQASAAAAAVIGGGPSPAKKANQKDGKPVSNSSSLALSSSASKQHPSTAHQNPSQASDSGTTVKPAHSNTPYVPSPYLLSDHIQAGSSSSSSSQAASRKSHTHPSSSLSSLHQFAGAAGTLLGTGAGQHLASILHPKPAGHRQPNLPPAPHHLFLDPLCNSPLALLSPPATGSPPAAHSSSSRKRSYPFDNPGVFPSPDMVLDRIRSSTGLPTAHDSSRATAVHSGGLRQFDNPRDILQHTRQSFLASQSGGQGQGRHRQSTLPGAGKLPGSKSKSGSGSSSSKRSLNAASYPYAKKAVSESHGSPLLQQQPSPGKSASEHASAAKPVSNSNGYMPHQQHPGKGASVSGLLPDLAASSSKDGHRLTSALFGTQFTALPRSTKPSDLGSAFPSDPSSILLASSPSALPPTSSSSSLSAAAAAAAQALSLNPHLHPAFMNPFLPPSSSTSSGGGVASGGGGGSSSSNNPATSPSSAAALNSSLTSQLQMLASAYGTTPAQLAAYEEMLRHNGYGAFMLPGMPGLPGVSGPSPHHHGHHSVAVAGGLAQQAKGSKKH